MAGRSLYVADEDATYQLSDDGWRVGLGTSALSDESLRGRHFGGGVLPRYSVENQTTNAPPSSPSDDVVYVVGPSPTGAWSGKQTQIAAREDGAWAYYVPVVGQEVYDKALAANVVWTGAAWINPLASGQTIPRLVSAYATSAASVSVTGTNGSSSTVLYTYTDGTAPTTAQRRVTFPALELTMAASASTKKLLFSWDGINPLALADATTDPVFAVFRDSEPNAILWMRVLIDRTSSNEVIVPMPLRGFALSSDASSHIYRLSIMTPSAVDVAFSLPKNASFMVQELSA
jgi:hypothetical protein